MKFNRFQVILFGLIITGVPEGESGEISSDSLSIKSSIKENFFYQFMDVK